MITTHNNNHHSSLKRFVILLPVIVIIGYIVYLQFETFSNKRTASPVTVSEMQDSISHEFDSSIRSLDSLKPVVAQTISKIKYYESQKQQYQKQVDNIQPFSLAKNYDNSYLLDSLKRKLSEANNEIARLKSELNYIAKARNVRPRIIEYDHPAIEVPGDNSVVVSLDGSSRKGEIFVPDNLTVYLIPYEKRLKKLMSYDSSCEELSGQIAKYYKGVYFFNDVEPGKYIIKVCTYMGNYKLIDKQDGKLSLTMQVAPPIQ